MGIETQKDVEDAYCEACRQAGKDIDCKNCDRSIKKEEKTTIGKKSF